MVTVKCDMCGKNILNDDGRITVSFPKEECFVCYDICKECSNKVEEFIKTSHKVPEEQKNKCNREYCEGCESFVSMESPLLLNKLHIGCHKLNQTRIVDLEHTVKPEDFYEEEK